VINDTIRKIEDSLRREGVAPADRQELLRLLGELKTELSALESTRADEARAIALLAKTAHEAPPAQRRHASERLAESVRDFETSHPRLTSIVEAVAESRASARL
jgi:Mg2+ and Co2+ transporter CorA